MMSKGFAGCGLKHWRVRIRSSYVLQDTAHMEEDLLGTASMEERKANVGGWKVITGCTVSTPRYVSTSQPLKRNNSPQLGWGQILLQAPPRSPVKSRKNYDVPTLRSTGFSASWALSFWPDLCSWLGPVTLLHILPSFGLVLVKFPRLQGRKWARQACTLFLTRWVCDEGERNFPLPSGFFWLA